MSPEAEQSIECGDQNDWAVMLARDEIRQLPYRYAAAIEARDFPVMLAIGMLIVGEVPGL